MQKQKRALAGPPMAFAIHLRNTGLGGGYGLPACGVNARGAGATAGWMKAAVVEVIREARADAEACSGVTVT